MLTHAQLQARLAHQGIAPPTAETPAEVARRLGALQAQDYHQAVWAVGVRLRAGTLAAVEAALAAGIIVRTWTQRGTIHLVAAEDAAWMVRLSGERTIARARSRLVELRLTDDDLDRGTAIIRAALAGRVRLTRADVLAALDAGGVDAAGQRGYYQLWVAAHRGVICIGPLAGKQQTFALLDEWAQPTQPAPVTASTARTDALAELARRYFGARGPATAADFAWWAGITLTDARLGLEGARAALMVERVDGVDYWTPASAVSTPAAADVVLLPGYDEYYLGYQRRGDVVDEANADRIVPGNNGVFFPMIVSAGRVIGTWKRTIKARTVAISLDPFAPLTPSERAQVGLAAERYAAFHNLPLSLID